MRYRSQAVQSIAQANAFAERFVRSAKSECLARIVPLGEGHLRAAVRTNKWKVVGPKHGFLIQGDDPVGAIADLVGTLADAKINVTAIDAVCVDGRYGALCWVAPPDVKKTAQILGAQ